MTFSVDFSVNARIQEAEVEGRSEEDVIDRLQDMTLQELVECGYIVDFSISDVVCNKLEDDWQDSFEDSDSSDEEFEY